MSSRNNHDSSPPRRVKSSPKADSPARRRDDGSPPRKRHQNDQQSPPRRKHTEHASPPRVKREASSSPRRRRRDESPPRRSRESNGEERRRSPPPSSSSSSQRQNDHGSTSPRRRDNNRQRRRGPPSPDIPESMMYGRPEQRDGPPDAERKPKVEKEKPDFKPSGKLTGANSGAAGGQQAGPALRFNEPPDAHMPTKRWRLYVFKEQQQLDPYYIHRQSCYLFGRDRTVVDIPLDHPSCSKQHALLQFRPIEKENEDGDVIKVVKPYIIDLESTNGTFINDERIEAARYYEVKERDLLKFGLSTREFVILHDESI